MTEYIDKKIAINVTNAADHTGYDLKCVTDITDVVAKELESIPAADVRENIYGKWISDEDGNIHCSVCGRDGVGESFCEHCGADMRGKKDEYTD